MNKFGSVAIIEGDEEEEDFDESPKKVPMYESEEIKERDDEIDPELLLRDTKSFFMHKGKGKYEDIQAERNWRLKKIKQDHKPMNYDKLKEHEAKFKENLLLNKIRRQEELKKRAAELEENYQERYKSKTYTNIENSYHQDRNKILLQKEKGLEAHEAKKELGKEFLKSNFPQLPKIPGPKRNSHLNNPVSSLEHAQMYYGRFGRNEFHKSVDLNAEPRYNINRDNVGNRIMAEKGKLKLTEDQMVSIKERRQYNSERDALAPLTQSYKTGDYQHYVKNCRETRRKSEILEIRKRMSRSMEISHMPEQYKETSI